MFTVFTIEKRKPRGVARILPFLLRDKLTEEYKEKKSLVVRNLHYISRKKQVNWQAVFARAGYDSKSLVCSSEVVFPKNSGLCRFNSNSFFKVMTENFALQILKEMENPQKIKIAFLDFDGERRLFAERLCELSDNFIIITGEKRKYFNLSDKMMNERGVSLVITSRINRMNDADFVIAPSRIRKTTDLRKKSLVLTCEKPCFDVSALCYYKYRTEVPSEYKSLVPNCIDEDYFLSALYSKGRQYNLSNLIPKVAYNENSTCTVKSMAKYLDRLAQ